jgi:hypothetical protein
VQQEHAVDAAQRRFDAVSVVEIADGDVDAGGKQLGAGRVPDQRADVVALFVQELDDATADVAGGSSDEMHG